MVIAQWRRQGGSRGGSRPPNDFQNRLLHSSKFGDEKEACAGGGVLKFSNSYLHAHACFGWSSLKTLVQIVFINPVIGQALFNFLVRFQSFHVIDTN